MAFSTSAARLSEQGTRLQVSRGLKWTLASSFFPSRWSRTPSQSGEGTSFGSSWSAARNPLPLPGDDRAPSRRSPGCCTWSRESCRWLGEGLLVGGDRLLHLPCSATPSRVVVGIGVGRVELHRLLTRPGVRVRPTLSSTAPTHCGRGVAGLDLRGLTKEARPRDRPSEMLFTPASYAERAPGDASPRAVEVAHAGKSVAT